MEFRYVEKKQDERKVNKCTIILETNQKWEPLPDDAIKNLKDIARGYVSEYERTTNLNDYAMCSAAEKAKLMGKAIMQDGSPKRFQAIYLNGYFVLIYCTEISMWVGLKIKPGDDMLFMDQKVDDVMVSGPYEPTKAQLRLIFSINECKA